MFQNRKLYAQIIAPLFMVRITSTLLLLYFLLVVLNNIDMGLLVEAQKYQHQSFDLSNITKHDDTNRTFSESNGKSVNNNTNSTSAKYLTYQDPISGFQVQYPSNWIKIEGGNYVEFQPPSISQDSSSPSSSFSKDDSVISDSNTSNRTGKLIAFEIRVDGVLPFGLNSLEKYTRAKIIPQKQIGEFKLIESNGTNIGDGNPAYKVVYTNTFQKTGVVLKTMEITTVKDNIGYDIKYFTDPATDYPKYLNQAREMIDSIKFIALSGK